MNEPRHEKTIIRVFLPGPTQSELYRHIALLELEISDLESRGIILSISEQKGADQLRGYRTADLRLCFCLCENQVLS